MSNSAISVSELGSNNTVGSFAFTNANGFTGTVTNPTTTPNLTLSYTSPLSTKTSTPYTVLTTDNILEWNGTANGTFNLYAVSGNAGRRLTINNITTQYTLTLDGNASETIEGLTTYILYPGNSIDIYCDGTKWDIINRPTRVLINTTVVSTAVASVGFTSLITSQFKNYTLELLNVVPSTDDVGLWSRVSANNGSSFDAGVSDYSTSGSTLWSGSAGNVSTISVQNTSAFILSGVGATTGISNTAGELGLCGKLTIYDPSNTSNYKSISGSTTYSLSADNYNAIASFAGHRKSTSAINAIQLIMSSGNIASGIFKLYGEI